MTSRPTRTVAVLLALLAGAAPESARAACGGAPVAGPAEDESLRGIPVRQILTTGNDRTRDEIVVQEVLMQPGDPYDPELARESERNLRALPFLGSARVVPRRDAERGVVDLEVVVTERFPWVGAVLPSFGGGKFEVDVVGGTGNFLGRGQIFGFRTFQSSEVEPSYYLGFVEPRIGGSRWGAGFAVGTQGGVGPRNRVEVRRRLYSLAAQWAFEARGYDEAEERLLYEEGEAVSDYYRRSVGGGLGLVRSFRDGDRRHELGVEYDYRDDKHRQAPDWNGALPEDKRRAELTARFTAERFRYVKDRHFSRMGPVEDLKLGHWGTVRAGAALELLGSDRSYPTLGVSGGWFGGAPEWGYYRIDASADGRLEGGGVTNLVAGATARLYVRTGERGLLAWRGQLSWLDRTEDPLQLLLDSPGGLRGYPANAYEGTRRLLANLEWRQSLLRIGPIAAGMVAFVDGGAIWSETRPLGDAPFLVGVGAGLRLGLAKVLGAPVLRLDLGYGLRTGNWELSGGIGQRF